MRYALLQQQLEAPHVEKLRRAFRSVRCLTDYDANILANDAYGILVKNLSAEDALALEGALAAEGVATQRVPENQLPPVPPAKFVHRAECLADALMIYDPAGRRFPVEWRHVTLIAAGSVRLHNFKKIQTTRRVTRYNGRGIPHTETVTDTNTREELAPQLVLEIILGSASARYSFAAEKFNFAYLGERKSKETEANFALLVRDLIQHAPHAAINRGAYYFREQSAEVFSYPSKNAFFEEIVWLLWRMNQENAGPAT